MSCAGIALVSEMSYPVFMKGITIKLPEMTLQQLRQEARATGRSVAEIVRDCLENRSDHGARSVYALSSDLAGSVSGVENLQQTSAAGFDERDHDLRHGTARRISQPQ